jgi:periplasmic protein TonB
LLKSANPVYPPDAMRSFITGDVTAEAVVQANGHVGEVKVMSGPKPLQQAAVDALKQYQYAPAMQGGKAVSSKVTVVVKFWFNP